MEGNEKPGIGVKKQAKIVMGNEEYCLQDQKKMKERKKWFPKMVYKVYGLFSSVSLQLHFLTWKSTAK